MVNAIVLVGRRSFTLGLAMMFGISIVSFVVAKYFDFWYAITKSGAGMYLKYIVMFGLVCFMFLSAYVLSFARTTVFTKKTQLLYWAVG